MYSTEINFGTVAVSLFMNDLLQKVQDSSKITLLAEQHNSF